MKAASIPVKAFVILWAATAMLSSCNSSRMAYDPQHKFSPARLQEDYGLFREILEHAHPSLYWYTPKDSMDYYFNVGYSRIRDSMTETQFRMLLSYVASKINCGHTSVHASRSYEKYIDTATRRSFPFAVKCWGDTMIVTANLHRNDPELRRGTILKSINGYTAEQLRDTLFNYVTMDGYSVCGKYQTISTGFTFGSLYKNLMGLSDSFDIRYLDSGGYEQEKNIPVYDYKPDTSKKNNEKREPKLVFFASANIQVDTTMGTAFMTLNTFDRSNHLRRFFRQSFETLKQNHINNLIIDVRSNGGGDAGISTLLTRYLIDKKFKLADSLYAVGRLHKYGKYMRNSLFYKMELDLATRKRPDGKYHFTYFEKHYFKPKEKNHYDGQVYILIGGNSFSATTLFAGALKGQQNVTLVGEETGGGYYGNSAWIIPDVTLPNSKIQFRLPLFRMVVDKNRIKDGRGIMPDVWAVPSTEAIRRGIDFKAEKVRALIELRAASTAK
jgi:Peptidase family S41